MDEEKIARMLPKAPRDVLSWIKRNCVKNTYVIYDKELGEAICTRCGYKFAIDTLNPKHNSHCTCPNCQRAAIFKSNGIGRKKCTEYFRVMIFTRRAQTIFASITEINAEFDTFGEPTIYKNLKQIIKLDKKEQVNLFLHYAWCFGNEHWEERKKINIYTPAPGRYYPPSKYEMIHVYDKNFMIFENTDLKYLNVPELYDQLELSGEELIRLMDLALKYPAIEMLIKFGYEKVVLEKINGGSPSAAVNWRGKTIQKILRCTLFEAKQIKAAELTLKELKTYQDWRKKDDKVTVEAARLLSRNCYETNKEDAYNVKVANYIAEQNLKYDHHNTLGDYVDYKKDCEDIRYDWARKRNRFPANFYETHQNVSQKAQERKEVIDKEKFQKVLDKLPIAQIKFEYKDLFIKIPVCQEEIKKEGEEQGHCVGRYTTAMSEGKCIICFIRKKKEPEKSYYTVELSPSLKIRQCRGAENCGKTPEVDEFVRLWEKNIEKLLQKEKRLKKTA